MSGEPFGHSTRYTVSMAVSVETWARNPGEAHANAVRAISTDNAWARRVHLAGQRVLVRLTRPTLTAPWFYSRAAVRQEAGGRSAVLELIAAFLYSEHGGRIVGREVVHPAWRSLTNGQRKEWIDEARHIAVLLSLPRRHLPGR